MWEYVKGSEQDFAGYSNSVIQIRKRQDNGLVFGSDGIASGTDWLSDIIAERRKVDSLQSRVNDANLQQALTGLRVNYYLAQVKQPQREEQKPYRAECEDIIQALNMTFDEGCLFKALWRNASARLDNGKPGQSAVYDAEKMMHYASRIHKWELSK